MADNSARIAELDAKWRQLADLRNALGDRYSQGEVDLLPQIKELNAEIRTTIEELDNLTASSSNTEGVPIVSSIPLPSATTPQDTNVDPENPLPFEQSQSTPAQTENSAVAATADGNSDTDGSPAPTATGAAGTGADDDNPQQANSEQSTNSNSNSNSSASGNSGGTGTGSGSTQAGPNRILPQPNILDQFATYTWQASIYLLSPDQYNQFITNKKKNLSGYNLLIQNSGAPINQSGFVGNLQTQTFYENNGTTSSATANAGRSPAFPLDFYIDNIVLRNYLLGKGTGIAHNASQLSFQITEPNGITLLSRLYQAVQDAAPRNASGPIDYTQAQYLLVLRWYGFDEHGNPKLPASQSIERTDPNAAVEKYIPFQIRDISFTVSNRLVTYDVTCNPVGQLVAGTSRRGSIPADLELTGQTVFDVLVGNSKTPVVRTESPASPDTIFYENDGTPSSSAAPPNAAAAPLSGTARAVGLVQAMNSLQQELASKKTIQYADTYEIVFAPGAEAIKNAKVTLKNPSSNQGSTPMSTPQSQTPDSALPEKQNVTYNGRNIGIPAGASMLYAIDKIIRDSSYVYEQANVSADESEQGEYKQNSRATPVKWYNILTEAVPDGSKYDSIRNAPVYKIRYTITPYVVQNFVSRFFPSVTWLGVHKSYPYWFTGQNTAVLDYQANFNAMYQLIVSGSTPGNNAQNAILKLQSSSMQDQIKWYYAPRSDQSTAGAESKGNEIPAEAAEYLYGASSLGSTKIKIIGDPAWIQQGSLTGTNSIKDSLSSPFLPDGTINFDGTQPMFEIAWQKPQDYDIATGLADPYAQKDQSRLPKQSYIYTGREVTSEFRGGRFEQTIEGWLYPFPVPDGSNAVAKPPGQQDPRRIDNPNGGLNSTTGQPLKTQPGVNNSTGTLPAPDAPSETNTSNTGGNSGNGDEPTDTVASQDAPEAPTSDGTDVEWAGYDAPPKLGESGGETSDPNQYMVLEA